MIRSLFFSLLLATVGAQDCSNFQSTHSFEDNGVPILLDYVVTADNDSPNRGLFSAQLTYEGQGWLALGFSPTGGMIGSLAVVGLPDEPIGQSNPGKYNLAAYDPSSNTLTDQQTLMDHSITQNATHTVLRFSKYLKEAGEVEIDPNGSNNILVAAGFSNDWGFHSHRTSVALNLKPCQAEEIPSEEANMVVSTPAPTVPPAPTKTPTSAPSETPTMSPAPTTSADGVIDCSEFQASHAFADIPITIDYVVTEDDTPNGGILTAQVTYEGQGYVAAGFSSEGRMIGSLAVIGLPDEPLSDSNPGKYNLGAFDPSGVTLTEQQTLMNSTVVQNDTHTVLTFSKYLKEEGEIELDSSGTNFILVAVGSSNTLGFHLHRASVGLTFQPCQEGQLASDATVAAPAAAVSIEFDDKKKLFKAHGILAALAWGVLAPLAIANSLCRHLIPGQGVWFQMHRGLNILVLLFTIISFSLVVKALQDTSAGNARHFQPRDGTLGKHHTIGLLVMILVVVQSIAGILRPHTPEKGEEPTPLRVMWEYGHRICGMTLLGMGWYQCHSGLVWYSQRFVQDKDYTEVFWGITLTIAAIGVSGKIHGILTIQAEPEQTKEDESDPATSTNEDELPQPVVEVVDTEDGEMEEVNV